MDNSLQHFGVLGMKWGVRKSPEQVRREKAKMLSIAKRGPTASRQSDIALAKRVSSPIAKRATQHVAGAIMNTLITSALTGNISRLNDPKYVTKLVAQIAGTTAANIAIENALGRSMAKNYTDKGRMMPGVKDRAITKQDATAMAISAAPYIITGVAGMAGIKMNQINKNRASNEAKYNDFVRTNRILETPMSGLGEFIFSNSQYDIYDKPR